MTKTTITRLMTYFIFIGLPILAMMNCSGWGANDGTVNSCFFEGKFFRIIANFLYNTIYFSSSTEPSAIVDIFNFPIVGIRTPTPISLFIYDISFRCDVV